MTAPGGTTIHPPICEPLALRHLTQDRRVTWRGDDLYVADGRRLIAPVAAAITALVEQGLAVLADPNGPPEVTRSTC